VEELIICLSNHVGAIIKTKEYGSIEYALLGQNKSVPYKSQNDFGVIPLSLGT